MKKIIILLASLVLAIYGTAAQSVNIPLTLSRWDTMGVKEFITETYMGKECVLLKTGAIKAKDIDLRDGTIEADISFPQKRGFPGFVFRIENLSNFENFYVRPHQSGNPDATQYTPVFNDQAGWQLYYGDGYSREFTFKFDQWHHVKIRLHGLHAEIYIDDMENPIIKVKELLNGWKGGTFGLTSGGVPLRIANVQYSIEQGSAPAAIPVPANGTDGLITHWQVSNVIRRSLFEKAYQLTPAIKQELKWTSSNSEPSGIINLSRFGPVSQAANTMVAKVVIESNTDQVKVLNFGFSDLALVYLNDKALYGGSDIFMSRDYRFLGTVGFFDALYLPLQKGTNELLFVISENFGGWGVKAKFENMEDISLK